MRVCGSLIWDSRVVRDQERASLWQWVFDAPQLTARLHLMLLAPLQDTYAYDGKHLRARPYVDKARQGTETLSKQLIYTSKLRHAVACCAYNENKTQHVYTCRCMQQQVPAKLIRKILHREEEDESRQRSRPIRSPPRVPPTLPHKARFPYEWSRTPV